MSDDIKGKRVAGNYDEKSKGNTSFALPQKKL